MLPHWTTGERLSWLATTGITGAPLYTFLPLGCGPEGAATASCEGVYC